MTLLQDLGDLATLAESQDVECKAAQGRDGHGKVPDDLWKSYSGMANTEGGTILLGVQEKPRGTFKVLGLADVERVRKAVWDNLHNPRQVSANLLTDGDVQPMTLDGRTVLCIRVPRASRRQRPVHVGPTPWVALTCGAMGATTRRMMKRCADCWPSALRIRAMSVC